MAKNPASISSAPIYSVLQGDGVPKFLSPKTAEPPLAAGVALMVRGFAYSDDPWVV